MKTNILPWKQKYKRVTVQIPQVLLDDIKLLSLLRNSDPRKDIAERIRLSLVFDDTLMVSDRIRRLIFCKQLSYEYNQRKNKGR